MRRVVRLTPLVALSCSRFKLILSSCWRQVLSRAVVGLVGGARFTGLTIAFVISPAVSVHSAIIEEFNWRQSGVGRHGRPWIMTNHDFCRELSSPSWRVGDNISILNPPPKINAPLPLVSQQDIANRNYGTRTHHWTLCSDVRSLNVRTIKSFSENIRIVKVRSDFILLEYPISSSLTFSCRGSAVVKEYRDEMPVGDDTAPSTVGMVKRFQAHEGSNSILQRSPSNDSGIFSGLKLSIHDTCLPIRNLKLASSDDQQANGYNGAHGGGYALHPVRNLWLVTFGSLFIMFAAIPAALITTWGGSTGRHWLDDGWLGVGLFIAGLLGLVLAARADLVGGWWM